MVAQKRQYIIDINNNWCCFWICTRSHIQKFISLGGNYQTCFISRRDSDEYVKNAYNSFDCFQSGHWYANFPPSGVRSPYSLVLLTLLVGFN